MKILRVYEVRLMKMHFTGRDYLKEDDRTPRRQADTEVMNITMKLYYTVLKLRECERRTA